MTGRQFVSLEQGEAVRLIDKNRERKKRVTKTDY